MRTDAQKMRIDAQKMRNDAQKMRIVAHFWYPPLPKMRIVAQIMRVIVQNGYPPLGFWSVMPGVGIYFNVIDTREEDEETDDQMKKEALYRILWVNKIWKHEINTR
ncbi:hypothetical protein LX69_01286 [Breznakibacter xylanolyticus]|uniref:Uncharacterized protein n=2 Tax=Breznakibacter xylanolyticus TaxID=990 RepID=A0A2W7NEC0_9BACT|nr:hypothetical protein LX69_01286 [Breznakibacter xylanolyticus]